MKRYFFTTLFLTLLHVFCYAGPPCDLSLLTIDLKYNEDDGVKICEIQQGLNSELIGPTFLTGSEGFVAEKLIGCISKYHVPVWFCMDGVSPYYRSVFKQQKDWKEIFSFAYLLKDNKFSKRNKKRVLNHNRINDYHGLIITGYNCINKKQVSKLKGVLVLNRAFLTPFGDYRFTDKLSMSQLFTGNEQIEKLKPAWKVYDKQYSKSFVGTVLQDFLAEHLVIKPRVGLQGRGVIILHRSELGDILRTLFDNPSTLKDHEDKAYSYWATDNHAEFLIEEFYPSTPVAPSHLNGEPYDGTMRVIALMAYDEGVTSMHVLYSFWKLPKKSLVEEGTLTEKHKSFSGSEIHYGSVDQHIQNAIEERLQEGLIPLYEKLL